MARQRRAYPTDLSDAERAVLAPLVPPPKPGGRPPKHPRREITDLTPAERRVWQAFSLGQEVDFREGADDGPEIEPSWGPERNIRATVIRALLVSGPVSDGEIAGLKLTGARITGRLDLNYGTIDHPVRLRSCHFEQPPKLYGAQLRALILSDSVLPRTQ